MLGVILLLLVSFCPVTAWVYLSQEGDVTFLSHTSIGGKDGEGQPRDLFVTGGAFVGRAGQSGNVTLNGDLILHHPDNPKVQSTSGNLRLHARDEFVFTSDDMDTQLNVLSYTGNAALHLAHSSGNNTEEKRISLMTSTANEFIIRREDLNGGSNMLRMVRDDTHIERMVVGVVESSAERSVDECTNACSASCERYCTIAPDVDKAETDPDDCLDHCNAHCVAECEPVGNDAQARTHVDFESSEILMRPGIATTHTNTTNTPQATILNSLYGDARLTLDATHTPTVGKARLLFKSLNETGGDDHRYAIESHPDGQLRIGTIDQQLNIDTVLRIDSNHHNDIHAHYRMFAHKDVFQTGNLAVGHDIIDEYGTPSKDADGYGIKDRFVVQSDTGRVGINVDVARADSTAQLQVAGDVHITHDLRINTLNVSTHVTTPIVEAQPESDLTLQPAAGKDIELVAREEGKIIIHSSRPTIRAANTSASDFFIEAGTDGDRNLVIRPNEQGSVVVGGAMPTLISNTTLDITVKNIEAEAGSLRLIPPADQEVVLAGRDPTLRSMTDTPLTIKTPSENRDIFLDPHHRGTVVVGGTSPTVRAIDGKPLLLRATESSADGDAGSGNVVLRPSSNGVVEIASSRPSVVAEDGKNITLATVGENADILLQPHGVGKVVLGGTAPTIEADQGQDLILRTSDDQSLHLVTDGGVLELEGSAPTLRASQGKPLTMTSLPMADKTVHLMPYQEGVVEIRGDTPTLRAGEGKALTLQANQTDAGSVADIELVPSAGGVVMVGGTAPTIVAKGDKVLTLQTTGHSSNIQLKPDGAGVVYLGGDQPTLRSMNADDDLRLESGARGNLVLTPGESKNVIIEGDVPTLASQTGKTLVLETVSDNKDIHLNPHGTGSLVVGGTTPTLTTTDKPLHLRSTSTGTSSGNIAITTASGIVSIHGTNPTIQAADQQELVLATVSDDRNVVMRPHGTGRLVIGGNAPTLTVDSNDKPLELRTGTDTDLFLTSGDGSAVVIQSGDGARSELTSAAGNDLVLTTRSQDRDVVLQPHGTGLVKIKGDAPVVESADGMDLTLRSGGLNSNVNLKPDGEGSVVVGGTQPTVRSKSASLTLRSQTDQSTTDGNIYLRPSGTNPMGVVMIGGDVPTVSSVQDTHLTLKTLTEGMNIYLQPDTDGHVVVTGDTPTLKSVNQPLEIESGAGEGSVVLGIPDGGHMVIDSDAPTLTSVENTHLYLRTVTENKNIYLSPHGTGHVVLGGDNPTVTSQSTEGLRLSGGGDTAGTGNVVLRHAHDGSVQIAGSQPTVTAIEGADLHIRTLSDGRNVVLDPHSSGYVEVGGDDPAVRSTPGKPLMLQSGEGTTDHIYLNPAPGKNVVIAGDTPTVVAQDDKPLQIATTGTDADIQLYPDGEGVVVLGGDYPTIQAATEGDNLRMQSGVNGSVVLVPGDGNHVIIEGTQPTVSSTAGRELRLETPNNDRNIVLAPDGIGRVVIESGGDVPSLVAETGKPLRLGTVSDNMNIHLTPHGTGSVRVGGEKPTLTSDVGKVLRLESQDSAESPDNLLGEIKLNSTQGIVTLDALGDHPTLTTGEAQELHITTRDTNKDIFVDPHGEGRVIVGGDVPTIAADSLQLELRSGQDDDIVLKAGALKAVVISDGRDENPQSVLTSVEDSHLTIQTRTDGKDVVLNPNADGNVVIGGDDPTVRAIDDRDLKLVAGGVDRNIRLVPNGEGQVVVGGSNPTLRSTNRTLTLKSPTDMAGSISTDIHLTPAGNASVIIGGDTPTVQAKLAPDKSGSELTVRTTGNDANIKLVPDGEGQVVIGGNNPTIRSLPGDSLTLTGGEGPGNIVLSIPGESPGGSLIIDSNEPTLTSAEGKDLHIVTPSDNKCIHLTPHGDGHIVVGGHVPTLRAAVGKSLTLVADPANDGTNDVVLSPGSAAGKVEIQGDRPTVVAKDGSELTIATVTDGKNINLQPNANGVLRVGGSDPTITAEGSKPLTLRTAPMLDATGCIRLNPPDGGAVVIAGDDPTIRAQDDLSLTLQTTGLDSHIYLSPDNDGTIQVGGTRPTVRAIDDAATLTVKSGAAANLVLEHGAGEDNAVVISAEHPTIRAQTGKRLRLMTEDTDADIVVAPDGAGRLLLESDVDHVTMAAEDGKELMLETSGGANIVLTPNGDGKVYIEGDVPTLSTDPAHGQPLLLSATADDVADSRMTVSSSDGIVSLEGVNPTLTATTGQDLTLATQSDGQHVQLLPHGAGRVLIGGGLLESSNGSSAVVQAGRDDLPLTLRSGSEAQVRIEPGAGHAVVVGDGYGHSELTGADGQDLTLTADGGEGSVVLLPASGGTVQVGGDTPLVTAADGKNLTLQAGGDSADVVLRPTGQGSVVVGGDVPTIESSTSSLRLVAAGSTSTALSDGSITLSPLDAGQVVVGGDAPTVTAKAGHALTLATPDSDRDIVLRPDGSGAMVVGGDSPTVAAEAGKSLTLESHDVVGDDSVVLDAGDGAVMIGGSSPTLVGTPGKALTLTADPSAQATAANIYLTPMGADGSVVIGGSAPTLRASEGQSLSLETGPGEDIVLSPGDAGKVRVASVIEGHNSSLPLTLSGGDGGGDAQSTIKLDPGLGRYVEIGGVQPTLMAAEGKPLVLQTQTINKDIKLKPAGNGTVSIKNMLQLTERVQDFACTKASDAGKMWHYNGQIKYCTSTGVTRTISFD